MSETESPNFDHCASYFIDDHKPIATGQVPRTKLRYLFTDSDENPKQPGSTLSRLTELYIRAAEERTIQTVLIWPGYPSCLPIIHSLTCLRVWQNGSIRGMRGLYYPAKKNSFYTLSHVFVDPDIFCSIANSIYRAIEATTKNGINAALEKKMLLFFGVKSLKKDCPHQFARPSLNEIFPHFTIEEEEARFTNYSDRLYSKVRTKMYSGPKKALVERTLPALGDPCIAPDPLFAFGYRLTQSRLSIAVKEVQRTGRLDVVLLDGTYSAVKNMPDWRKRFVTLIQDIKKTFGDESPGTIIVTDEPRQMSLFNAYLKQADSRLSQEVKDNRHGIIHTGVSLGLEDGHQAELMVPEGKIRLSVTDYEVGAIIDGLNELAKSFEEKKIDAAPIRNAIRFVAKLSHLPGSYDNLWDYLNSQSIDSSTRNQFDWLNFKNDINRFMVENGDPGLLVLNRLIADADRIVDAYRKGTPLGLKVLHEIERSNAEGRKCVTVVGRQLHRAVLAKYLDANDIGEDQQVILSKEIRESLETQHYDSIVFAHLNSQILHEIVSNAMLPGESILVLTLPMARELRYTITPLLQMKDFEIFHPRLSQILSQLDIGLSHGGKPLIDDGFFQPSFSFSTYDYGKDLNIDEREKVLIEVKLHDDDRSELFVRGRHSQMYVLEPETVSGENFRFREVEAGELERGQEVFFMPNSLRDEIEAVLKEFAFPGSCRDAQFENALRGYHACILGQIKNILGGNSAAQLRRLKQDMLRIDPDIKSELNNIKYWVDLGKLQEMDFSDLTPHAPRRRRVFKAFCQALCISEKAETFWINIQYIRGIRRNDGRILSDLYSTILFDPESAEVYKNIPRETINNLRRKAIDHVHTVIEIVVGK